MFGRLENYSVDEHIIELEFTNKSARVEVITSSIFRIISKRDGKEQQSRAIEGEKRIACDISVQKEKEYLRIQTKDLIAKVYDDLKIDFYDKNNKPLSLEYRKKRTPLLKVSEDDAKIVQLEGHTAKEKREDEFTIQCVRCLDKEDAIYGLGDKTGCLNKRYYEYEMWNTDNPDPHEDSFKALYKSIPFFIVLKQQGVYGIFFDNHNRSYFDMGKENEDYYVFGSKEGNLDYYFIGGTNMKEIIMNYTYLTGRMPLPQLWTLGYHQSRWSYETQEEVERIAENLRRNKIPCDAIHLDIDYMQDYKVFTWNKERYDNEVDMIKRLGEKGFKFVTIIDPGVKREDGYDVYEEGCKEKYFVTTPSGDIYVNEVWPGEAVFPDFGKKQVREWWAKKQKFLIEKGVRGVWNDMNEPASFKGPLPDDLIFMDETEKSTHKAMHNLYGHNMAKASYEGWKQYDKRRPFVITRACYSGSQKYALGWTGDNQSLWTHLRLAVVQLMNSGISGFPYMGTDIGGFGSDTTKELLSRWIEVGCFSPLCRNHCAKGCAHQEPWVFDQDTLSLYRKFVSLRYTLLPYLYDTFYEASQSGIPMIRALVLENENDPTVRNMNDEFLVGSRLLVAPVLEQGKTKRLVYLPEGVWYDYETNKRYEGNTYLIKDAPIDCCPMYIKEKTILPTYPVRQCIDQRKDDLLLLKVYGDHASYIHYQDNGEDFSYQNGEYNRYQFTSEKHNMQTIMLHEGYKKYKEIRWEFIE